MDSQGANSGATGAGRLLAYSGLVLTTLFWAGNVVVARGFADQIPPVALSFWRWFLALLILLPLGLRPAWARRQVIARHWKMLLVLGALSVGFFNTLLYLAAQTTSAANIGLINSTMPVMVILLAWLTLGQRPSILHIAGIMLAIVGTLVVVSQGSWNGMIGLSYQAGDLLMVLAVFFWSIFSVMLNRYPIPLGALEFLTAQIFFGVLVILPFYLLELVVIGGFSMRPAHVLPFTYVALFPGLLAYALWNHGVRKLGPNSASMSAYLVPVFAAALAWALLGEALALYHALGGFLILLGVFCATRR